MFGSNGVAGVKVSVLPDRFQVPGTAGRIAGSGEVAASGADSVTWTGSAPSVPVVAPPSVTETTWSGVAGAAGWADWDAAAVVRPDARCPLRVLATMPATASTPTTAAARPATLTRLRLPRPLRAAGAAATVAAAAAGSGGAAASAAAGSAAGGSAAAVGSASAAASAATADSASAVSATVGSSAVGDSAVAAGSAAVSPLAAVPAAGAGSSGRRRFP